MNIVSFFHRFVGPPPPESPASVLAGSLPIEERYWSPPIQDWLLQHRFAADFDPPAEFAAENLTVKLVAGGAHAAGAADEGRWIWTAWITLAVSRPAGGDEANTGERTSLFLETQGFLSQHHYWAPAYPGHSPRRLRDSSGGETTLAGLLEWALPAEVRHLARSFPSALLDQRLGIWAALDTGGLDLRGESLRSLLDLDPPQGMEAPQAWTSAWLAGRTYERWRLHGIVYGFTHHSGFVLHSGQPWLERLCRPRRAEEISGSAGVYFDLALLVFSEVALDLATRSGVEISGRSNCEGCRALRRIQDAFPTAIDQGRDLLRIWRRVCHRDLGLSDFARPTGGPADGEE